MEAIGKPLLKNPRENANIFSILTFWWTIDLFRTGYQKVLELNDLFKPLKVDESASLGDRLEKKWLQQRAASGKPSLIKAIFKTFWREYTIMGVITFINDLVLRLASPLFLGRLLNYFRKDSDMEYSDALWAAASIVFLNGCSAIFINQFVLGGFQNGMKVRVAVCSLIYRKALKLSRTALGDTAPGKVVNLLSNDVSRFDMVSIFLHSMWSAPLLTIIVAYLLWREAGIPGLVGMIVIFIVTPLQSWTSKLTSRFRLQTAMRTDERVRLMDEVISGVQVIKLYAWEKPFAKLITLARKMELKIVKKSSYVRGLYMTFGLFTTRMALFCTMLSMALLGDELTASKVFVIASYYHVISHVMSQMFVRGIAEIAEALVAMRRLQTFLDYEEKDEAISNQKKKYLFTELGINGDALEKQKLITSDLDDSSQFAVSIKNATARWSAVKSQVPVEKKKKSKKSKRKDQEHESESDSQKSPTLDDLNLDFKKGLLIGVIGPVGSGKSSFLETILQELPLESGSVFVNGTVSYASQEPWVFAGSVKQNILFGEKMHNDHYNTVIKSCALLTDFEQLPHGDDSIIGERGSALSGGQRARISLARAVYRKADIYLLDDPLSAVDAHVGRHLFDECIGNKGTLGLRKATRILVTHQVHFLKDADWIVILKDGRVEVQGSPHDLSKSGVDFIKLLESFEKEDSSDSDEEKSIGNARSRSNSKSSSKGSVRGSKVSLNKEPKEDEMKKVPDNIDKHLEQSSKGKVQGSIAGSYIKAGANKIVLIGVFLLFVWTQVAASTADYWVSFWTAQEEQRKYEFSRILNATNDEFGNYSTDGNQTDYQAKAIASSFLSTELCMWIHGALVTALLVLALLRSISFYNMAVRASQTLHDDMFNGIISTKMRFFDTNPSGRILNRFSKDMGSVDELLPKAILDASQIMLMMFGAIIVASIVNYMFLIPVAFLTVIFMYIRKIYLKTSKNVKRLEGIARSPVFTHLGATLQGLPTIRAFGAQGILKAEFDNHQDLHTSAWYMFITTSVAFGFILDLMCLIFVFFVVFSFLVIDQDIMGNQVGLAITQVLALTGMIQWGIRQSAEVANQLMSVERILEYRDLPKETQPEKPLEAAKEWPPLGKVEFKNVTYRYFPEGEAVLHEINFVVRPEEKVGIVGRTGAGKSSLIGTIFRLAEIEGDIIVDGVKTGDISLEKLRSKISIIPQDPVLFSGTLRRNLDPFEEYPDASVWRSLDEVELKEIASGPLGLQTQVAAGGSNFSVGQRQLICLARAILRDNKILVLDEATANVDPNTDALIQQTIRQRFAHCTVLTVAHRLNTIMDSDRVLVMNAGRVEEFDAPYLLLKRPASIFKEMVAATGNQESEHLARIAKEHYESSL